MLEDSEDDDNDPCSTGGRINLKFNFPEGLLDNESFEELEFGYAFRLWK